MIIPSKFNGYNKDGTRNLFMGGGGGGPTQTTSTVQNTNIPAYAQPYVESMLGATQNQLFNTKQVAGTPEVKATYDDQGNQLTAGTAATDAYTSIEGFKPYQAYGGTYDAQGKQLAYDPNKAIAGFQDMQLDAQRGIGSMRVPDQYNQAINFAGDATRGAFNTAQPALGYGAAGAAAGQQGANYGQMGYQSGMAGQQLGLNAAAAAAALAAEQAQRANKFGDAGFASGQKGQELGIAGGQLGIAGGAKYGDIGAGYGAKAAGLADPALAYGAQGAQYGGTGAGYGEQAAKLANTALGYGQKASDYGQMGLMAGRTGADVASQSQALARQQAGAGAQYAQMATDPSVTRALMNPYTQNVLDVQNKELQRQSDIAGTQRGAQAARAGAFGGSRQAVENAEANRSLAVMKNANQAQALQQAYQQAQAQQQFGANLNLQGLAGAQQGLGTALSGGQLGLSGLGTALQGQQGALAGVGQAGAMYGLGMQGAQTGMQGTQAGLAGVNAANQAYQAGMQGAGLGLQGVNTQLSGVDRQLAGTGQGMQGAQVGLQGVSAATAAGQLGLQGAQVGLQGTAQGMQGAQTGIQGQQAAMQGAGMGLQGVQGAQAAYGLGNQTAASMANTAAQQLQAQQGIYGMQNTAGGQQQALEQAKINQSMLDYANAQQYPLMQLGTMSNMLRGLPMQASTTNQYAASPNPISQAVGTIGAGASIYNAFNPTPRGAAGGEVKGYAKGGIMSYDMGGEVESQLENMDEKGLAAQAKESSSPSIRRMAQRLLRERQMSKPQGASAMGVQYQAAQPQMPSYAPGGIVAFVAGGGANEEGGEAEAKAADTSGRTMEDRLAMPPSTTPPPGGIMGATTQPTTQVPVAPPKPLPDIAQEAMRQRDIYSAQATRPTAELLKEIQAERDALGVGDNKPREELRSQQMAERANMKDEQERQRNMRLAEFFASWGSTPGPVLVAGMNALKQSIPNIVSDEKEAKKARKEADKIIYDIDEATRLEKLGMHKEAVARKEKAASHAEDYNKYLLSLQGQREGNQKALEVAKIQAKAQTDAAAMRNSSDKLGRQQAEALRNEDRIFLRYQAATKEYNDVLSDVAKQESQDAHKNDLKNLTTYTMGAVNKKTGEIDVNKISPSYKAAYAETLKRVNERKEGWNTAIEDAKKEKNLAFSRIKNLSPEAMGAQTGPKVTPTDSGVGTTGDFPTPTAKHIQALKDNPNAKAEFDGKFGPGAAAEYLGK